MLIKSWMTKEVITLTPERTMMKASKLMKDNGIKRLPVVDTEGKLVGIVSDRDIKEASPSKATTLDTHELYYLLSEIKVKDIMTTNPEVVSPEDTVEKAAAIMQEKRIGGMPVVDDKGGLVGIITDSDVFKVLIHITGVHMGGVQFGIKLSMEIGTLNSALEYLRDKGCRIISILTSMESAEASDRSVFIRIHEMDRQELKKLKAELEEKYEMLYWTRDTVHSLT